jgi:hypothetical protein
MRESDLEALICDALRLDGVIVLQTGKYIQSQRPVNSDGTPDLYVWRERPHPWPKALQLALEVKLPDGEVGTIRDPVTGLSQQDLADMGATVIVRSLEEAQAEVARIDALVALLVSASDPRNF